MAAMAGPVPADTLGLISLGKMMDPHGLRTE